MINVKKAIGNICFRLGLSFSRIFIERSAEPIITAKIDPLANAKP